MSNSPNTKKKTPSSQRVQKAQQSGSGTLYWVLGGGAAALVVILLIVAIVATRGSDDVVATGGVPVATTPTGGQAESLVFGKVTVDGTNLPQAPQTGADPALGKAAPTVTGQRFDGSAITIPSAGTPKIVMLVAHWCPHCQKEVPLLTEHLKATGMPAGVDLYAVSTSVAESRGNYPPAVWLSKAGWPVPTLVDDEDGTAANAYGLTSFPTFVVIDASGKVVDRQTGEKTVEEFDAMVAEAKSGQRAA